MPTSRDSARDDLVRVLKADPDLAEGLADDVAALAAHHAVAAVEHLPTGLWQPSRDRQPGHLGLLVLSGLLVRIVELAGGRSAELLGEGDLLRPWDEDDEFAVSASIEWSVIEPTRLAVLDRDFAAIVGRWPEVMDALLSRATRRSRSLAVNSAIGHRTRASDRVLLLFRHVATRWGRVTTDGIVVHLPLTHESISRLVGTRRPTVTTALGELADNGLLTRTADGSWVLTHEAAKIEI